MMILSQRQDAEYVTSIKDINDIGYQIKAGSKGIKIVISTFYNIAKIKLDDNQYEFKPFFALSEIEKKKYKDKNDESITFYKQVLSGFKLGNVFDIKDTTMPIDLIDKELNPKPYDIRADDIINCFIKTIYKDNYKVEYEKLDNNTKGYCNHAERKNVLREDLSNVMKLKVLIHEYAHAIAHSHLENNNKEYKDNKNKYVTEAESISYVVAKYIGIDTNSYSLNYLYNWSKEKDFKEIDDSLNTIVNYSKKIINNFEKFYNLNIEKTI